MVLAMVHTVLALVHIILDMEGTVDMGMVLKAMRNRLKHMLSNQVIKLSPNHMLSHKYTLKLKAMLNLKRTLSLNNRTLKHNHIVRRKHTSLNRSLNHNHIVRRKHTSLNNRSPNHNHMLNQLPHTAILKIITNLKPMIIIILTKTMFTMLILKGMGKLKICKTRHTNLNRKAMLNNQ